MTPGAEFRAHMKAVNGTTGNDKRHLNEAEIVAYYRGEMPEAEREAAQAHIVECEQCVALFRSARDFLEPAAADEAEVSTGDTENAWRSFWQQAQSASEVGEAGRNIVQAEFQRPGERDVARSSRLTLALAASLLISFGILGLLGGRFWQQQKTLRESREAALQLENKQRELEQRLSRLEQSGDQLKQEREQRLAAEAERDQLKSLLASVQPNHPNIPVFPFRLTLERGSEEELRLTFKKSVPAVMLRLFQNKPYEFSEYAIELVDQRGQVVRTISRLRTTGDGALSVLLNRGTLSTGKYKLRLFGQAGVTRKPLGEYGLAITVER